MNPDKLRCAEAALRTVPGEYLAVTPEIVAAVDNGHAFHRGMHVGWAWADAGRGWFLDFLSEHRMAGMSAQRFHVQWISPATALVNFVAATIPIMTTAAAAISRATSWPQGSHIKDSLDRVRRVHRVAESVQEDKRATGGSGD